MIWAAARLFPGHLLLWHTSLWLRRDEALTRRSRFYHKPVISAQSSSSDFKHPAEAWARGHWAPRWAGSGFGWRASDELAARLRMLKPHVIGQRWSALLEQGSSAAAEALMPSQSLRWALKAAPATEHALLPRRSTWAFQPRTVTSLPDLRKGE